MATGCTNHPDRPAIALCMACRSAVCQECTTTRDGIHYCARCLPERFAGPQARTPWLGWLAAIAASAALALALTRVLVWAGVWMVVDR